MEYVDAAENPAPTAKYEIQAVNSLGVKSSPVAIGGVRNEPAR